MAAVTRDARDCGSAGSSSKDSLGGAGRVSITWYFRGYQLMSTALHIMQFIDHSCIGS